MQATDLFFSEYIEGSSNNKALELYNATGATIDLAADGYQIEIYFNGNTSAGNTIALTGSVADGDVYVVADNNSAAAILAVTDQQNTGNFFNGDDTIILRRGGSGGTIVDVIGDLGFDPGSQWGSGVISTQNNTIVRRPDECVGDTNSTDDFEANLDATTGEWDGFAQDDFTDLGMHTSNCTGNGGGGGGGDPDPAAIVINEIDYDQPTPPTSDSAEFLELYNAGTTTVNLDGFTVELVNGNGNSIYDTITLPNVNLPAGGYFVICGDATNVPNCDLDDGPNTNFIQNGSPDAVGLRDASGTLLDAVSYEGSAAAPYVEGSGSGLTDSGSGGQTGGNLFRGIARFPDGTDTDQNNVDLSARCISPGEANLAASTDCPDPSAGPSSPVVINEVDADTPGTDVAEFVELFDGGTGNTPLDGLVLVLFNGSDDASYQSYDLDGQSTDADGYFVLCGNAANVNNCDLDVSPNSNLIQNGTDAVALFAGDASDFPNDTPVTTTNLIDAIVYDTADSDDPALLVLLNAGQPQVDENGNFNSANESNQRIPNGSGGARNTDTYTQLLPTPGAENVEPPSAVAEIFEIQGAGLSSPLVGSVVTTNDNVVTALAPDGFFMQTPTSRSDNNPNTSDGIFVFTGSAPGVSVGDIVDVTGEVIEFFEFTEFSNGPTVTVDTPGGGTLPAPVVFDANTPSPDPNTPSCSINNFECFEGMRVQINDGFVSAPNQRFNPDPRAEVFIVADGTRPFREPGIEFPGLPGLPVWDGNPEVFELDPDKLGLPNQIIPGGSTFDGLGVVGFEFGGYEFWPITLSVDAATLPEAVPARGDGRATVGSLNLFRFFDDVDDPANTNAQGSTRNDQVVSTAEYDRRREKFADYILNVLRAPDILAVQEAEKLGVLEDLAAEISSIDPSVVYTAFLEEGNDIGTIDVGFLVRNTVQVSGVTQLGRNETFIDPTDNSVDLVHDRPPLLLEGTFLFNGQPTLPIAAMVVHNRSFGNIDDPSDGPRVRQKRLEQAQSIAAFVQDFQTNNPTVGLTVLGDFNDFEFSDGFVDVVGQISGSFNPSDNLLSGPDLVNPNLTNQVLSVPANDRYSFIFRGTSQVLDHILTTQALNPSVSDFAFARGNADAAVDLINDSTTPLRSSDHDGLVLFVNVAPTSCPNALVLSDYATDDSHHQFIDVTNAGNTSLSIDNCAVNTLNVFTETFVGAGSVALSGTLAPGETFRIGSSAVSDVDLVIPNGALPTGPGGFAIFDGEPQADGAPFTTENETTGAIYLNSATVFGISHLTDPTFNTVYECVYGGSGNGPFFERNPIEGCLSVSAKRAVASAPVDFVELMRRAVEASEASLASEVPQQFELQQNYPNPFNPQTVIRFAVPEATNVKLVVYDLLGRQIQVLVDGNLSAGWHEAIFEASNLPSGLYLYRLETPRSHYHQTMVLTK